MTIRKGTSNQVRNGKHSSDNGIPQINRMMFKDAINQSNIHMGNLIQMPWSMKYNGLNKMKQNPSLETEALSAKMNGTIFNSVNMDISIKFGRFPRQENL